MSNTCSTSLSKDSFVSSAKAYNKLSDLLLELLLEELLLLELELLELELLLLELALGLR